MKTQNFVLLIAGILFTLIMGYLAGIKQGQNKKVILKTPDGVVKEMMYLYNFKPKLPNGVFIGVPAVDTTQVHLFKFIDPVEGLQYVGIYKKQSL